MYKKFLVSLVGLLTCFQSQCVIKVLTSMDQKKYAIDFYAWMIWKTSKEYTITYHTNESFKELELEPTMAEISIDGRSFVCVMDTCYDYKRSVDSLNYGVVMIDLRHGIGVGVETQSRIGHYYLIHYRASENPALFFTQKIMEFPELKKFSKNGHYCNEYFHESFATNKDGTMVVSVLKNRLIVKIIPKRIPSKNVVTFNHLYDVKFKYV